jgi:glycosyltransferase involved in cell wall biosynthesis
MAGLSVIIITKNEALNIRDCIESIKWADEIIVVDSGSTDDTVAICREYTPHVYSYDWPGFGMQKNRALDYATQDWVLSLDADERVTSELRSEIEATMRDGKAQGYEIPRLSSFCGRFMHHSGWYPDYVLRLFRRGSARFSDNLVHEKLITDNKTQRMKNLLLHYAFENLEEVLHKTNQYSTAGAQMQFQRGRKTSLTGAVLRGLWSFVRSYVLRLGFLDGREGFILAVSNAEGTYYRYIKLLMLNRKA